MCAYLLPFVALRCGRVSASGMHEKISERKEKDFLKSHPKVEVLLSMSI